MLTGQGIGKGHQGILALVTTPGKGTVCSVQLAAKPETGIAETRAILEEASVRPD